MLMKWVIADKRIVEEIDITEEKVKWVRKSSFQLSKYLKWLYNDIILLLGGESGSKS